MNFKLKLLVGALASGLSVGAAAQMPPPTQQPSQPTGGMSQQPPTTQPEAGQVKQATAADIKAGAEVYDQSGASVGKVDSVDADGVVVSTGKVRAKIPASSLGRGDKGLVIAMSKTELEAAAEKEKKPQ